MIVLRDKLFWDYNITSEQIQNYGKTNNLGMKASYEALKGQAQQKMNQDIAQRATERAANKAVGTQAFKQAAQTGGKDAVNQLSNAATNAYKSGQGSVGLMGGLKNTWAQSGKMGKAGMVAAGTGLGLAAAKGLGLFGGSNKNK
jgi:hypothetical protein